MLRSYVMALSAALTILLAVTAMKPAKAGGPPPAASAGYGKEKPPALQIPESLRARHEAFHAEFSKATKEGGKIGDAARAIEKLGEIHFAKAKDAFPPLGLLPQLAEGKVTPEMGPAIKMAENLRANLPKIRGEHIELVAGLKKLADAAKEEGNTDYVRFAERLTLHIQEEEEVLYPTVILIGEYLKRGLDKK